MVPVEDSETLCSVGRPSSRGPAGHRPTPAPGHLRTGAGRWPRRPNIQWLCSQGPKSSNKTRHHLLGGLPWPRPGNASSTAPAVGRAGRSPPEPSDYEGFRGRHRQQSEPRSNRETARKQRDRWGPKGAAERKGWAEGQGGNIRLPGALLLRACPPNYNTSTDTTSLSLAQPRPHQTRRCHLSPLCCGLGSSLDLSSALGTRPQYILTQL